MNRVSATECKRLLEQNEVELIDVREPWEVAICSIGGKKVPMHEVPAHAQALDKEKHYVILCKTGKRAESVANFLECGQGFKNISVLEGGITHWYETFEPSFEMY